jgi:hypothetical protein
MALSGGNTSPGVARSNIFTNIVKVTNIEDQSSNSKADVSIKVTVQQENYEYPNTIYISGWHKYDDLGQLDTSGPGKGWGSSFKVKEFFENCGVVGDYTDDVGRLLPHTLSRAMDAEIWTIRYPSSRVDGKRVCWDRTSNILRGKNYLLEQWKIDRSKGYPKDYIEDTQAEEKSDTEFPFGNNLPEDTSGIPSDL